MGYIENPTTKPTKSRFCLPRGRLGTDQTFGNESYRSAAHTFIFTWLVLVHIRNTPDQDRMEIIGFARKPPKGYRILIGDSVKIWQPPTQTLFPEGPPLLVASKGNQRDATPFFSGCHCRFRRFLGLPLARKFSPHGCVSFLGAIPKMAKGFSFWFAP